jgi:hypothetical protein
MKKYLFIAFFSGITALNAQDLKSKKGEPYLPQTADWGLQIDAVPFLEYAGKLLSNNGATAPSNNSPQFSKFAIAGKYFKNEKFAYRGRVRIGFNNTSIKNSVINNSQTLTDTVYTNDTRKNSNSNIQLAFGFEKRRGSTRLQGFYGAEANLSIVSNKTSYSYGNGFTRTNTSVFTTDFTTTSPKGYSNSLQSTRVIEDKDGTKFGLGARAFVGAEYFILPKFSLGAEFGWGILFVNSNSGQIITERWDTATDNVFRRAETKPNTNTFAIDTDNASGALFLNFYF